MAVVLVVIGLIVLLGVPLVGQLVKQNKLAEDRSTVNEAKSTLIGYGQARAGYPSPDTGNLLPHATLTMRGADAEGNKLVYDVNDKLTVTATGGNLRTFCINVRLELALNNPPKFWNSTDFTDPTKVAQAAFVVISRGPNFTLDRQNTPVPGDRVYENPSSAFTDTYQDVVATYSLLEVQAWCNTNAPDAAAVCPAGSGQGQGQPEILWIVTNNGAQAHGFKVAAGEPGGGPPPEASSCYVANAGQTVVAAQCENEEHMFCVWSATNCKGVKLMNCMKLKDVDTNDDGIAHATCTDATCTYQ
jgi:type II secretory pathway pseudopilin PulG